MKSLEISFSNAKDLTDLEQLSGETLAGFKDRLNIALPDAVNRDLSVDIYVRAYYVGDTFYIVPNRQSR